jgi:hypothetical protein
LQQWLALQSNQSAFAMAVWPAMGNGKQRAERTAWPPIDNFFSELFDYKSNTCSIFLVSIFVLVLFAVHFPGFFSLHFFAILKLKYFLVSCKQLT